MSQSNQENVINIDDYDLAQVDVTQDNGKLIIDYLMGKPQDTMENPRLQKEVLSQLQALQVSFNAPKEREPVKPTCGFVKGGISLGHEDGEEKPRAQNEERHGEDNLILSENEDMAPRRRRDKRTPSPPRGFKRVDLSPFSTCSFKEGGRFSL